MLAAFYNRMAEGLAISSFSKVGRVWVQSREAMGHTKDLEESLGVWGG